MTDINGKFYVGHDYKHSLYKYMNLKSKLAFLSMNQSGIFLSKVCTATDMNWL